MISRKMSRVLAFRATLRWLRYLMYALATSFLELFMSSSSTMSWISSTDIWLLPFMEMRSAIC